MIDPLAVIVDEIFVGGWGAWKWDATRLEQGKEHVTIAVSGAEGGKTVDFRKLADQGVTLLGMTKAYQNGVMTFKTDLKDNIANGDKSYLALLKEADVYIKHHGLDLPMEEEAHNIGTDPKCLTHPITSLNLSDENITSIIWATGFKLDYNWLKLDIFDEKGVPKHQRGVSTEPGVYFLGLPWQSRRGSSFIWGVWHDAKYIADQIVKLQNYWEYHYKNLKN